MALESDSEVYQMRAVQDAAGKTQPPASDASGFESDTDIDISDGITVEPYVPGRPSRVAIHVEASAAFRVQLDFEDEYGTTVTSRTPSDNPDYQSDGTTDVFVSATPVSPYLSIDIEDTSGGPNTAAYNILVI